VQFGKKLSLGWLELSAGQTTALFSRIAEPREADRQTTLSEKISTVGIGYGYRFKMFQSLMKDTHFFEHTNALLTYSTMNDFYDDQKYSGPGLKADLLIAHRFGQNIYWGFRLSYNLHSLSRAAIADEPASARTMSFSWLSTGVDIGIYF
jgi:hypothetical protein